MSRALSFWFCAIAACLLTGCSEKSVQPDNSSGAISNATPQSRRSAEPVDGPYSGMAESGVVKESLRHVEHALDRGAFDDAAAQLLRIRMSANSFSPNDGTAYRTALSDTYSKALEAAGNGNQRGRAAVQMIRAAGP